MALTPGTRLGHYSIAALIGTGGMGEVYRATDLNLGRAVRGHGQVALGLNRRANLCGRRIAR
ncbi:MAG: hypothetical protein EXQ48_03770 [Acidobacteria bacterium]|nr:hypothetical protein [Acidobacteriota bacterium]